MIFGLFSENFNLLSSKQLKAVAEGRALIDNKRVSKRDRLRCSVILKKRNRDNFEEYRRLVTEQQNLTEILEKIDEEERRLEALIRSL